MNEDQAIAQAAARAAVAYRNGDDTLGDYWTERVTRLSDEREAVKRRMCAPATFYETPSHA